MAAKILVVEEDEPLKQLLQSRLEAQGFNVVTAVDGEAALRAVGFEMPDAIILDLELQGQDGLSVCRQLRANPETARVPLLVLSGEGEQIDQLLNNDLDADDFMTKPYNDQELSARLKGLLKRTAQSPPTRMIRAGSIEMDLDRYVVKVSGKVVSFTSKEFELLRALMEAKGRALRREYLLEKVWGYGQSADVESRTVDVHIRRLREKLGPDGAGILTVRNVGYRFDMSLALLMQSNASTDPT
ncbi:MAG TPA: response regulator transcription factor [Patescibacteria group bacterium]|nr:response regulator transcription factor [Patescibacteria group bacterium]